MDERELKKRRTHSVPFPYRNPGALLSVIIVGGYGFLVWIMQIIGGPPTG